MITQCSNCSEPALYVYEVTADFSLVFCSAHLPNFLRSKGAPVALVQRTEAHAEAKEEASKKLAPKTAAKTASKKSLMAEAPLVDLEDTGLSDNDESEVVPTDGPED